ncbi:MAG: Secretion system C-terminal sorting domain, partial [Bacteroidota bacterium]
PAEISIVNTTGQRLLSKTCNNNSEQFDVTSLVQGTYFVEINSGVEQKTMKFIKIR